MKKILALVLALVLCLGMTMAQAETAPIKVAIMVSTVTHGWVGGVAYHADAYAKELTEAGVIEYKTYTSSNAEEMTTQFDEAKLWGAQALVIAPQWTGMEVAAQAAIDEGLVVVAFDMDIPANGIYKVTGDNESMGVAGAEYIVEKIGTTGKVATIEVPSSGSINELRLKGFMETMAKIAPDVEILHYSAPSFAAEEGMKVTADILTANPELDAIFSEDDESSIGALQAIADAGRTDIKAITGGGGAQSYFALIKERTDVAASSALYSPLMIKDCIDVAIKVVNGETVEPVIVVPSQIVRAENVDEYLDPANTIY